MKRFWSGLLVAASCVIAVAATAQISTEPNTRHPQPTAHGKPVETAMKRAGSTSVDLRQLPPGKIKKRERPEHEEPESNPIELPGSMPMQAAAPVGGPSAPSPGPSANFAGLDFANWGAGHPPDTNGDVGPTYFIETVNTSIGIYNKSTGVRVAAFTFDTFMSQGNFGNLCDTDNFGDPVVLYDTFEDRWVISDFAFQIDGSGNVSNPPGAFECIAVSKTGDPVSGGWNFYSINTAGGLGDYPKLGVWPDGIYMSVNMFDYSASGSFQNVRLYAFKKAQMYAGAPDVQVVSFDAPAAEFTMLPANARLQAGTPPAGTPNYFSVVWQFTNAVSVYKFHVDWNNLAASALTGPFTTLAPASWGNPPGTVPSQGGNANETLPIRLMVQNQYTNIAGVESLWNSHTVQGSSVSQAAVRYYQVNVTGGTVAANTVQAATHNPDANSRYLPSVAIDRVGDMAIGYNASGSTLHPAIRYAGRLATDPVNTLAQSEASLIEGAGSQSGNCGDTCTRWGDYSSMSLDTDGCTFWMSNEYYAVTGLNWVTRIGSFKFAACTPVSSGSVQGTVTATAGGAPIAGATVSLGSRTTTTNGSGAYSFANIPSGTYPALSAAAAGYTTSTTTNIVVTDGNTTTNDFSLATAPASACPADTTQADFQLGVPTNVDLTTSPGDVRLANSIAIDQQNGTVTNSGFGFNSTNWAGQTFSVTSTGQLAQIDLDLFCSGCTGTTPNITVSIRATSGSPAVPTGADLATATIAGFNSGAGGYFSAVFGSPPTLTAGTTYAVLLRAVSNPSAGTYAYLCSCAGTGTSNSNPYVNGQRVTSANSGTSWTADTTTGGRDLGFRIYMNQGFSAGDLVSSPKDSNSPAGQVPDWSTLSWTASTPANTLLRFQAAASASTFGPFNFVGPDGTAGTFYTTSGGSLSQFGGYRYLRYRAYLSTTSNAVTPALNDATVCYTALAPPDLSIGNSDGVSTAVPGNSVNYTITATNSGPSVAIGATVTDTFPAGLTCSWTCGGSGGGKCPASGSGNINDPVTLPNGASVVYNATCSIAASATGSLVNTATVTAPAGLTDPNTANNSATDTDTLTPQANLGITKTDAVTTATPGGSVSYTITASNPGPSNAPTSTVADAFPAALTCNWTCGGSGGGSCAASGSGNISNSVNLPSGGSVTYTAVCSISASASGSLVNTATVSAAGGITDPTPGNNGATDTDTLSSSANLGITKTDGVAAATPGGSVSYTITASNAGPSNAPGSTVADSFPTSLTCSWTCVGSGGGTCTASGSGNISNSVGLPSGGSVTYTASCNISASATGSLVNTATVSAAGGITDPTPGNNSATDTDTLAPSANLGITNTDGVATATPGGSVTYTITATNTGPSNAPGSTVADAFPASLTCSWTCAGSNGGTCTASGSGNINNSVNLPSGGSVAYTASCTIGPGATGSLVNTATVSAAGGITDPTPGNNSATDTDTLSPSANLGITKTDGVSTATPGGSVSYTITASNAGPSNAPGSTVADTFPASLTCSWTCAGSNGGTCAASGSGNINDSVNLPSSGSVTYTASCNISASASGSLVNTATIAPSASVTDPTPGNNSATDTDTLSPSANLGITKTDGAATATPGGTVGYTITASNPGPSNAPGSTVADTFPASLTCSWTCVGSSGGTCAASGSGSINDTVGLPSGSSVTYTASCNIAASATGSLSNTATVAVPAGITDPTPANNSATDTDTLSPSANLAITKSDGVTTATPGGSVTYTISASNAGPSNAPGSTVADTFPASLTCSWTCAGSSGGTCTASGSGNINDSVNLPGSGSVTYTASCNISASATGSLSNTATVTAPAGVTDPTPGNNSASDTDTLSPTANLGITNTDGVTTATPGGSVTYTLTAANAGPSNAPASTVADTFPASLTCSWTCVGANGGTCTASGSGNINNTVGLPSGGSVTYTASCTIGAGATGSLGNTATVTAPAGVTDPTPANNSATDTDTLSPSANLGVTKTDGVTTAAPGASVSYTIAASNAGPSNAPGSTVADAFPASLTCSWTCVGSGSGTCTASGSGNINDTVGLPSGGSVTYTAVCNISAAASGSLSNTATVAVPAGVTDPTPANNSATDTDTLSPSANLSVTKTDGVTTAAPGASVSYTIAASNAGPSNAPGSTVADAFPASLTCSWTCVGSGSGTCTASGSGNINDTVGLPSGGSVTYTAVCNISAAASGSLSNTATVAVPAGVTDPTPGNNSATDTDTLSPSANLGITNTDGVATATPGGSLSYTITASNSGPSNAAGSTVADAFPASLTCSWTCVGSGSGTCTASGSGNINDPVNLPSGGSVTYTASCNISASSTGSLSNTATVTVPVGTTDPTPGNNSATDTDTLSPSANLGITKTDGVATATPGGSVSYTITASNAGPSNAPGSTVADTFPASLTCSWTCTGSGGGTCTASGSGNINTSANLPNGGSVTYIASCTIGAGATGSLSNTATVTAPGGVTDPTPDNNSATDVDTLGPSADLGLTNTDGVTTATPGGSVSYTIAASNAGPSNAPGSTVADTFPASLTCSWTCVGAGSGTCTASGSGNINDPVNLPSGGNVTYTASCTIAANATESLSNTATVSTSGSVTDPTPANNSATDIDTLAPSANLGITNTDGVTTATPGGSVSYTITVSNAGPSNAPASTVADTFPASLTCAWTCVGSGSGACTASGSGSINDPVNLPSGGSVTYTAGCTIAEDASGSLVNTATVAAPAGVPDPVLANNSATDTDTLSVQTDLAVTLSDGRAFARVGDVLDYLIEVTNPSGPSAAVANVSDALPAELGDGSWTCIPSAGATCNDGTGDALSDTATIPVGGKASYLYSAVVQSDDAIDLVVNTASASLASGSDPSPANNSATDTDIVVIFRDGFDGSASLLASVNAAGASYVAAQMQVDAGLLAHLGIVPVDVASGRSPNGKRLFTLQIARFGSGVSLRTLATDDHGMNKMSEWQSVDLAHHVLEFAWQSASDGHRDGYVAAAAGGPPVIVDARVVPDRLTHLQITVEHEVPWLLLIDR